MHNAKNNDFLVSKSVENKMFGEAGNRYPSNACKLNGFERAECIGRRICRQAQKC
jgi:hypothetical protein